MKVALITDTHWGARGDSVAFASYFNKFYDEIFFPYLKENNINHIVHLGDVVDRRKYINYVTARNLNNFMKRCFDEEITLDVIIGNHDTSFKNTNDVNSMNELYGQSKYNVNIYSEPQEVDLYGLKVAFVPWICSGNYERSMAFLKSTNAQVLFGHLELQGFEMYRGSYNDHGFDASLFDSFDVVCSGHFHHKSDKGNIHYLGAPYEITWSDYNDKRGFHIFDTETRELEYIENPLSMFHKIYYDDTTGEDIVVDSSYKGSYIKIIVRKKSDPLKLDRLISAFEAVGPTDIQVLEETLAMNIEGDDEAIDEAEDTLTMLRKFVENVYTGSNKKSLDGLLTELYNDAMMLE